MPSRPGQRRSVLSGPLMPVPVSPIYGWFDTWDAPGSSVQSWEWTIPNDGMAYKLCNFNHISIPTGFMVIAVFLNGEVIWYDYGGYENIWRPAYANALTVVWPDVLQVTIFHVNVNVWRHYWEMDFWREQQQ